MSLSPGTRLGPYEIVSLIGAGGMGEVYRARDPRLARDVAIKVLPEDFLEGEERKARFEREAKLLAALNHPNIAAIYSFEEIPGPSSARHRHLLVMELVEGEPLNKRMKAGTIPIGEALSIARDIAAALEAAHAKGIVHRDLKPANVVVSREGRVKLLDFGLGKVSDDDVSGADRSQSPTLSAAGTGTGVILGTAAYMSPEQARGQPVDARTDVWALGVVLWELLTGRRLFRGQNAPEVLAAVLREPVDFKALPLSTPRSVRDLVARCLERDSEERLADVGEARRTLENAAAGRTKARFPGLTLAAAASILIVLAAGGVFLARRRTAAPAGGVKRVAVLPFENLGAYEDDYFADGVGDEIRGKLTSLRGVEVIARASSMSYRKTTKTLKQIARELDVKYILTATVRWQKGSDASRVHVSPELVEVRESGAPASKWQQPFDAALTDVFRVQSDIATRVAQALGVALGAGEEKRLLEKPTQNLAAWDAFLKGGEGTTDLTQPRKALGFYEQAVALDPGFAEAWARVSTLSRVLYERSTPTAALAERARQAAEKAVSLAPDRPDGYLALGYYHWNVLHDRVRAMEEYAKAQRIAPASADVLLATGWAEDALGRLDTAVEHFKLAARLDPRSVRSHYSLGTALVNLRRYPEARETIDRGLALAPASLAMIERRAETFLGAGDLGGARAALDAAPKEVDPTALVAFVASDDDLIWVLDEEQRELLVRLMPSAFDDNRAAWGICLAQAYALRGDAANVRKYAEEARKAFEEQLREAREDPQRHVFLGLALAYLGRNEEAIREGDRGVALLPSSNSMEGLYVRLQIVRIHILVGELEKALDELEMLERISHFFVSPGWLRIDPNFDPLRKNPRFQKLVAGK